MVILVVAFLLVMCLKLGSANSILGEKVTVFWPQYNKWYPGTVVNKNAKNCVYDVLYDDELDKEPIEEIL